MCLSRSFEVNRNRQEKSITVTAKRLIETGIEELMPEELKFRSTTPCSSNIEKLELDPIPEEGSPGHGAWAKRVAWYRRASGWSIHITLVHAAAVVYMSKLCAVSKSPSAMAVKEMKHLLCWFYDNREKGLCFGGKGSTGIHSWFRPRSCCGPSKSPGARLTAS